MRQGPAQQGSPVVPIRLRTLPNVLGICAAPNQPYASLRSAPQQVSIKTADA